ncbi:SDR family NAD(P)-dependent oxidoreductase [Mucilaginibacter pocheonensis]|uniref:NAD(P)-dependent dehydrogenase (Short-subunit alcohol dehydrogenase family) n=1 Tax=Mucilaginibacter pocheonensis TaxID=398050 RepID=A0ABU1T5L4_9SPHI|nr:SDR family oxidoreductase [Mucilaginibacter pocheonensis]MDR6940186.1 NAD(P)-dependent dehydrogenase (short-subunit alcohol dehydrogenase family) [Mucilaginibacter pocheonensis]
MDLQLTSKKALISGSTAGIGLAIAKKLAAEGAEVIVNGRTQQRVDKAIAEIKAETNSQKVTGITADFSKADEIDALIKQLPQIDILVNNVAIFEPKEFAAITDEDWMRFFEVNVLSGVRLSRAYFPKMLDQNWGRIIFISSESALQIPAEMIQYGTTKTAQLAVSRGLAELTKGTNVTVNTVLPGPTLSEGVGGFIEAMAKNGNTTEEQVKKQFFAEIRPTSLIQRFTEPEEVANLVAYIASPLSSATNGAALRADGGVVKTAV